jgi:TM2 domain-containing membrane protein YozV
MKSKLIAYFLWFFFGAFGFHKFYLGKWLKGLFYIMLFILGFSIRPAFILLGIVWLIDLFLLGTQVENYNMKQSTDGISDSSSPLANLVKNFAVSGGAAFLGTKLANSIAKKEKVNNDKVENSKIENDKVEKLRNIKSLLDSGVLTQEEFEIEKQKILNS